MSSCVSLISEMRIFRLTECNNIVFFAAEIQKRYKFSSLCASFAYFRGKTHILLMSCNPKAFALLRVMHWLVLRRQRATAASVRLR